jgi:hypothetical protein
MITIRALMWRDTRMWDCFHTVWHKDAVLMAIWELSTNSSSQNKKSYERGF